MFLLYHIVLFLSTPLKSLLFRFLMLLILQRMCFLRLFYFALENSGIIMYNKIVYFNSNFFGGIICADLSDLPIRRMIQIKLSKQ